MVWLVGSKICLVSSLHCYLNEKAGKPAFFLAFFPRQVNAHAACVADHVGRFSLQN
ncbi:hypothetical protein ABMA09_20405 [Erwinia rhapontici]